MLAGSAAAAPNDATLTGTFTGDYALWGPIDVEALPSRDVSEPPLSTSRVDSDGAFQLMLPADTSEVYIALYPRTGGAYPILLRELPVALPSPPLSIPLPGPPQHRDQRQALDGPPTWQVASVLLFFFGFIVFGGRWLLRNPKNRHERGIPVAYASSPGGPVLWSIIAGCGGLLLYGTYTLNEAMDLLEYTYFQEAYSGSNPLAIAFSPVVAERAHAPGYAILLWCMTRLSNNELWLRLPAILSALTAVYCTYRLGVETTSRRSVGWLSALLAGLSPLAMRYGRDVTPYSLVGLLAVASTLLLFRAIANDDRRSWALFAATGCIGFFLHYFTAFLVMGQALAVGIMWISGGRGTFWSGRLRDALLWFGALTTLPLLWASQVIRAFIISAQDNLVTHAVYSEAPGFVTFVINHLRVLMGLPMDWALLVWPLLLLLVVGYFFLIRDHPAIGQLLLVPFLLIVGLLATTYLLHSYAYAGRIYYGWRWLRPYAAATTLPIAYLVVRESPTWLRLPSVSLTALMLAATLYSGIASGTQYERPAQRAAAERIRNSAQNGDAIGVLPAAFYTVGWSYYLNNARPKFIHPGPSQWQYFPKDSRLAPAEGPTAPGSTVRVFGPIRSFGLPLESLIGHIDINRFWVTVFDERIFGHPEFDDVLPANILRTLDARMKRLGSWSYPFLQLVLYEAPKMNPWREKRFEAQLDRLYRSVRWQPKSLDPEYLLQVVRGERPAQFKLPLFGPGPLELVIKGAPKDAQLQQVRVVAAPREDHPGEARLQPPPPELGKPTFDGDRWRLTLTPTRSDYVEFAIERDPQALNWPLQLTVRPVP